MTLSGSGARWLVGGAVVSAVALRDPVPQIAPEPGSWRRTLSTEQATEVEKVAGAELRRVGYGG